MRSGVDCHGVEWEEIKLYGKMLDLTNKRFLKLTALFPVRSKGKIHWLCLCDCGNLVVVKTANLNNSNTRSCGCLQREIVINRWNLYRDNNNVIGKKFGRLTAIEFVGIENQAAMYRFHCDCGNDDVIRLLNAVKQGYIHSCGCLSEDAKNERINSFIGCRFGKLTVSSFYGIDQHGGTMFECSCDCGGSIITSRNSLTKGLCKSCGCIRSVGENNIAKILSDSGIRYKQQYSFHDLVSDVGGYPLYDFAILDDANQVKRLIEFDGNQHNKPYEYFGGVEKFLKVQRNDLLKNQYALSHNIPLVRIPYSKRDSMTLDDLLGNKYLIKGEM